MGIIYHSNVDHKPTPEQMDADIASIVADLWPDHTTKYRVERCGGVPTTPEDDRVARWLFWLRDWDADCAFTCALLRDGRMEFKVPRSQFDEWYQDQQKIRRRLVRLYNKVEAG
jgi:hypothetical protein